MKHIWKSKEKADTDVEEGLHENENIKREYVIQVVRETKHKWWCTAAIYMLVMFLFGLSYYMLRTYSILETMSVICQSSSLISESQFEYQKSSPSNVTSTESLTVDKLKLLENENNFPSDTEALAKSIAQRYSEMESDDTKHYISPYQFKLNDWTDSEIQRLKENSMENLNLVPNPFSAFESDLNRDDLLSLFYKIAPSSKKSDNMMPADDIKDLKAVPLSEYLKVDETHDEKSSMESGVVNCPPDKSDEFSSSESAQLEEKDNVDSLSSDHQLNWLKVPPFDEIYSLSPEKRLAHIRNSVEDFKQIVSYVKLFYGSGCKIIITKGVVDATLCPEFSESDAESNLESFASQTTTTQSSTQTNTILPSIQTSTMLPSTQTTTTTTTHITIEDYYSDYYDHNDSKDEFPLFSSFFNLQNNYK